METDTTVIQKREEERPLDVVESVTRIQLEHCHGKALSICSLRHDSSLFRRTIVKNLVVNAKEADGVEITDLWSGVVFSHWDNGSVEALHGRGHYSTGLYVLKNVAKIGLRPPANAL